MIKLSIIGAGNLGACIAFTIAERNLSDEIMLVDVVKELAEGNALDISHAIASNNNTKIRYGGYKDIEDSDIVIVTVGRARSTEMKSRLDLISFNEGIIRNVAEEIKQYAPKSIIVTLTNPMDIMNYMLYRHTGFERNRVIGSGQELDSARFKTIVSNGYGRVTDILAYVIGEHGDSQVPVFSKLKVKGKYLILPKEEKVELIEKCRKSSSEIVNRKGVTAYGPANNTANMIEAILKDQRKLMMCSAVLDGEYGQGGLSIGAPCILGRRGILKIEEWQIPSEEQKMFIDSVLRLKGCIRELYR